MKNIGIALLLLLALTSCLPDKVGKKDPEPELAGIYQMTSFVYGSTTLIPKQGASGSVSVVKNSDTQIAISLSIITSGQPTNIDVGVATINKSSGSSYDIMDSGVRLGSIDGTTFSLAYSDNTGSFSISAKK
ncbi:hypothetical protein GCM10028819_13820 [Spirosoma humi]